MSNAQPAVTFDEIRALMRDLPGPDLEAGTAALERQSQLTKPRGSLGRLEELAQWIATWQGNASPEMRRPRVSVFAGNHGIAARGVSESPAEVPPQMVKIFTSGGGAATQLAEAPAAALRVYELAPARPPQAFPPGPAM